MLKLAIYYGKYLSKMATGKNTTKHQRAVNPPHNAEYKEPIELKTGSNLLHCLYFYCPWGALSPYWSGLRPSVFGKIYIYNHKKSTIIGFVNLIKAKICYVSLKKKNFHRGLRPHFLLGPAM